MRYPEIKFMQPVFDLFTKLKMDNLLIPYYLEDAAGNNVNYFNGIRIPNKDLPSQYKDGNYGPFKTGIPGLYASPQTMMDDQIKEYKDALVQNWSKGWERLMKVDGWSTRGYLAYEGTGGEKWSSDVINYMETMQTGTGLWNSAFSETVMDSLDFDYPSDTPVKWWCIQGGSRVIADKMSEKIPRGIIKNGKRVTRIQAAGIDGFEVACDDGSDPTTYNHVITTIPYGCLQAVDTTSCDFGYKLNTAIRMLEYDASTKVAIKFTMRWWEGVHKNGYSCTVGPQMGGVSSTDRPTRLVVYPSYGMGETTGATIIVSYTWSQDALRFSSLCRGNKSPEEESLKALILRDLTDIHDIKDKDGNTDYEYLASLVDNDTYDAWSWNNNANSSGAFALFGPGQFNGLYPLVTQPVNGMLHFAGEATSVHHAWVLGAINSAARVLMEIGSHEGIDALSEGVLSEWPNIREFHKDLLISQVRLGQAQYQM
ncbi:flavin-containing amine oxidoreductase-domain containing protein [Mycena latifolia]|nr:flavin-containing amine oxidoreductase-domain containing protein [Mycena latifolia]